MPTKNKWNADNVLAIAKQVFDIEADAISHLSHNLNKDFANAVQAILSCKGKVVVCGMGKSGLVGRKIAATLASTGTPSFFLHPAEAFHGDLGMITSHDIFIGISNSGETEEIIKLIPSIKRNKNKFIAMAGNAESSLAKNADFFLNIHVEKEACPLQLAPTASTTATLAMGDALAVALMELREFKPENFALFHPGGSLGKRLLAKVQDFMRSEALPFVGTDTPVKQVIVAMTQGKIGAAIVVDEQKKLQGIITDGDLRRALEKYDRLLDLKAADIMTKQPKTIEAESLVVDAEQLMLENKINTLLVANDKKQIVGVFQLYALK